MMADRVRCILGDFLVVPFGGRAIASLAVVLGLALLDLGPRASAAFVPGVLIPQADSACGAGASSDVSDEPRQLPNIWPPKDPSTPTHWALTGQGESSSSSGSSSGPSSSVSGPVPWLSCGVEVAPPALVLRMRVALSVRPPSGLISSVFEPPKAAR